MRTLVVFGSVICLAAPAVALGGQIEETIAARCVAKWGDDYSMVEYCIKQQAEAANEVAEIKRTASGEPLKILERCFAKWYDDGEGADWPMVLYCWDKQMDAWERLNP